MRNVAGIILYVIAGFFFYTMCLMAFVHAQAPETKWVMLLVFSVPAIIALCGGLAARRFHNWKRETGIVLFCASGITLFIVFTMVCLLMTDEFRDMLPADLPARFNDYATGGGMIVLFAGLGWLLFRADKDNKNQQDSPVSVVD